MVEIGIAGVVQLLERPPVTQGAAGSSPRRSRQNFGVIPTNRSVGAGDLRVISSFDRLNIPRHDLHQLVYSRSLDFTGLASYDFINVEVREFTFNRCPFQ